MDKIKKYLIRGISIIMVAIVLVVSPASDYLDTQGIGETHAAAVFPYIAGGALITLMGLSLGVAINESQADSMYNEYYDYSVANNETEAVTVLDKIKEGAIEILLIPALFNSFANFLERQKGIDLDSCLATTVYSSGAIRNTSLANNSQYSAYLNSFLNWYPDAEHSISNFAECVYALKFYPSSNQMRAYYIPFLSDWNVPTITFYQHSEGSSYILGACGFTSEGILSNYYKVNNYRYASQYALFDYTSSGWVHSSTTKSNDSFNHLIDEFMYFLEPIYNTDLDSYGYTSGTLSDFLSHVKSDTEYAKSYGSYDQKNIDTLVNATVTSTQIESINTTLRDYCAAPDFTEAEEAQKGELISGVFAETLKSNGIEPDDDEEPEVEPDNPSVILPDLPSQEIPEFGEDVTVSTEVSAGEQAIVEQSVKNTNSLLDGFKNVISGIANLPNAIKNALTGLFDRVTEAVLDVAGSIWEFFQNPIQSIVNAFTTLWEWLGSIVEAILSIPQAIIDGIATVLRNVLTELFVPDTAELEETIDEYLDEFSFAFMAYTIIEDIASILDGGGEPPEIYIHFEDSEDPRFQQLGTMKVLDFAWYENYKPYGDMIISAILWAFFLLRFVHGLPNILRGVPQGSVMGADPDSINLDTSVRKL